jgi:hypothetical protein
LCSLYMHLNMQNISHSDDIGENIYIYSELHKIERWVDLNNVANIVISSVKIFSHL